MPGQLRVACRDIRGAHNSVGNADGGGRIDSQRHGRDIGPPRFFSQTQRQPGIDDISDKDADRRTGNHAGEDHVRRIVERKNQDGAEKNQCSDIIQK